MGRVVKNISEIYQNSVFTEYENTVFLRPLSELRRNRLIFSEFIIFIAKKPVSIKIYVKKGNSSKYFSDFRKISWSFQNLII